MLDPDQRGFVARRDFEAILLLNHETQLPESLRSFFRQVGTMINLVSK